MPDRSLGETESLARRAARGAGYDWGLADEAGMAARWLCARGADGVAILAAALEHGYGERIRDHVPASFADPWIARGANPGGIGDAAAGPQCPLCPIAAGAALVDAAAVIGEGITLRDVAVPALVLPFAAGASAALGRPLSVACGGVVAIACGADLRKERAGVARGETARLDDGAAGGPGGSSGTVAVEGLPEFASLVEVFDVVIGLADDANVREESPGARQARANPSPSAWSTLESFAARTYAPATEASRLKGAGAATSDDD